MAGTSMPMETLDLLGHPESGVYISLVGGVAFVPPGIDDDAMQVIQTALEVELQPMTIGGSRLLGALLTGNSRGMAVADIATEEDLDKLTAFGDVVVMESSVNAAGNLVLANENGVLASPVVPDAGLEILSSAFGVPAANTTIAGQDILGSAGVATNGGVLLHPDVTNEEVEIIEQILGVQAMVGTVCFGSPYVGAGCAASDSGAICGSSTTGPELNRIEDALGFLN